MDETLNVEPPTGPELGEAEMRWLAHLQKRLTGERSKYVPHQGKRERARRLAQEKRAAA